MSGFYAAVVSRGFRRYATYRGATVGGLVANTVFGFIIAYSYIALWDQRPHLGGYSEAQALTYVWVGQALLMPMSLMGGGFEEELMERIRSGDIAVDLFRPADLQVWWLSADLGRAGYHLLARGIVPLLCGSLAFPLALPTGPAPWLLFLASATLGAVVSFALRFLVALTAFWLLDGAGVAQMAFLAGLFFSGMLLPLTVFPGLLGTVSRALPWAAMFQVPADVLIGRHHGTGALLALAFQAAWAVVLLGAGRALQRTATRRVVVQGG